MNDAMSSSLLYSELGQPAALAQCPEFPARILLVEDEVALSRVLQRHLQGLGFDTQVEPTGAGALRAAADREFDLILLDLMLPDIDGFELCRRLRDADHRVPIIMLTAKTAEADRVKGLNIGADDYVSKPFSLNELVARIGAILRRVAVVGNAQQGSAEVLSIAGISLDVSSREVKVRGAPVVLTAKEFDLLYYFAQNPGRVYSRAQLLDAIWGYGHAGYEHSVNCHINRLRAKIERDAAHPRILLTVWGVGYKLARSSG